MAPMDLLLRRIRKEVIEMRYNIDVEWELDQDPGAADPPPPPGGRGDPQGSEGTAPKERNPSLPLVRATDSPVSDST